MKKILLASITLIVLFLAFVFLPMFFGLRPLSDHERSVLEPIFEESVDFDRVRIKSGGPVTLVFPGMAIRNTISLPTLYDEMNQKHEALLAHETCHIWQFQHFGMGYIPRSLWELITQHDTYVVHHDASKSFRDYDIEEQCEIVAGYYLGEVDQYQPYIDELRSLKK